MSAIKLIIHIVWSTKNRAKLLLPETRKHLFQHMREYATTKNINIVKLNGYLDHVHCLIYLSSTEKLAEIVKLLKGESSHWLNNSYLLSDNFKWQSEYFAESVSVKEMPKVIGYIRNQEIHHETDNLNFHRELHFKI
jgi:putative transposase